MTAKRSGAKRPVKKATKKAARKAAVGGIPSPDEVLGPVGAGLSERQREFATLYAADPNATRAYQRTHPNVTYNTARTESARLLRHPGVAEMVNTLRGELLAKYNVTNERIIEEYARAAFFDIADIYGEDGQLLPIHEMPEHARRAIAAIECDEILEWDEARDEDEEGNPVGRRKKKKVLIGYTRKVKTVSKREALQDLAKIRKMLTDRVEHSADASLAALILGTPVV